MNRSLHAALAAVTIALISASAAHAQQVGRADQAPTVTQAPRGSGVITARTIDLIPIPSRIANGVVSVRNTGTSASLPTLVTVNCHRPGQNGGCVDIPAAYLPQYTDAAYPNRLVVQVPAIQPGHVYNHNLAFWGEAVWPSGQAYQFDYVVDPANTNNESNEANNSGSFVWNTP